jgi:hypothetical protein
MDSRHGGDFVANAFAVADEEGEDEIFSLKANAGEAGSEGSKQPCPARPAR